MGEGAGGQFKDQNVFRPGTPITADRLNSLATKSEMRLIGGRGIRIRPTRDGYIIELDGADANTIPLWQPYNGS